MLINRGNKLAVAAQCCLLQVTRSRIYYKANGKNDAPLANAIADCYLQYPIYSYRRITACLRRKGYIVNRKCVLRLMREMGIGISMSGKGRSNDNAHIERLWRTFKYESVILHNPRTIAEYKKLLPDFVHWYNNRRPHQALDCKTPAEVLQKQFLQEDIGI